MPIWKGDGTGLAPKGFAEVRKGDGTVLWESVSIPPNGVAYYDFAGDATDSWSNNDATVNGATYLSSGGPQNDGAYSFDGNDYINCNFVPTTDSSFAWSCWLKTTNDGYLLSSSGPSGANTEAVAVSIDSGTVRVASGGGGSTRLLSTGSMIVDDGNWQHIVLTYDGARGRVYVNAQVDIDESWDPYASSETLFISRRGVRDSGYLDADIDNVRIYDSSLSQSDVQDIYDAEKP
jgi:hypothetical protein